MTKRKTVGQPRKERDLEAHRRLSKSEKERRKQRFVIIAASLVIGFSVLLLLAALIYLFFIYPGQAITTVNGQDIETKDFESRVRAERWLQANDIRQTYFFYQQTGQLEQVNQQIAQLADTELIGIQVLDAMELQIVLEEEAKRRGITVDEAEVQALVDNYIQLFTGRSLTPTPTREPTEATTPTSTPLITATPSSTPLPSATATNTPLPFAEDCEEGQEDCPTVTPLPTATATSTATETPEITDTPEPSSTPLAPNDVEATISNYESDIYDTANEEADVDREFVRDIFYYRALRDALRTDVTDEMIENDELSTQQLWAASRHILIAVPEEMQQEFDESRCESEEWQPYHEEALAVIDLLNNGEPFAALALSISDDPGSAANGGLYDMMNMDTSGFVEPYKQTVRDIEIGAFSEPVCTQFGFHIIQVLERELRDIPENQMDDLRTEVYQTWEADLLAEADIQRRDDWLDRIPDEPSVDDLLSDIVGTTSQQ